MARGMMPRPPSNPGRSQPPRRATQSRAPSTGQRTQKITPLRGPGADQLRQQQAEVQRQAAARAAVQQQRLRQQQYLREAHNARRRDEAQQRTAGVRDQVARLESILSVGLQRSARIDLDSLHQAPDQPPFDPGPLGTPAPAPVEEEFAPGPLAGLWGGKARKERQAAAAREAYQRAREQWETAEQERKEKLADAERVHGAMLAEKREGVDRYNSRIARVAAGLRDRDSAVVESFLRTVLRRVPLPEAFPRRVAATHHALEERAFIQMVLPGRDVVPDISGYEYEPPAADLRAVPRPAEEIDELYRLVLAQVALLAVRDVFEAEADLDTVTFHGLVDRGDPAPGEPDLPCLIRLDVSREAFEAVDLTETPPDEAVQRLGAIFSLDLPAFRP
jgi:restriction system protein